MKGPIILLSFFLLAGCESWKPMMFTTGTSRIHFYHIAKTEGAYKVPLEKAYKAVIRTMIALGFEIVEIKIGGERRVVKGKDRVPDARQVTIDLKNVGGGNYVKATCKASKYELSRPNL